MYLSINQPLVSIIISVLNGGEYIERALESIINQSYRNIEIVVIDGGSTDATLDIVNRYRHLIHYCISEPDDGIYNAWNKGVKIATGDWIAFLGSDDEYYTNAIESYVDSLALLGNVQYISSKIDLHKGDKIIRTIGEQFNWTAMKKKMIVAHVGSLHSAALFDQYGLFDETIKIVGDYEFLLRCGKHLNFGYLDQSTVKMRTEGVSSSDPSCLYEAEIVKQKYTHANKIIVYFNTIIAYLKWKIRRLVWY
jgi:glycosyltransferase involved in cell wall biosynthesis